MRKISLVAVAALFSTAALAQTTATAQLIELDDDQSEVAVLQSTVDEVEDMDLYDAQGTKLGEVEEVLGPDASSASALTIDLDDFDDEIILELTNVQLQDDRLVTTLTVDALRALPVWDD